MTFKIQKYLLGKMNELKGSQKLSSKITPINDRIEKIKKGRRNSL